VSPDGRSLYAAASSGFVSQYDIAADGKLTPKAPADVPAGSSPEGIAMTPDGHSVYVLNEVASGTVSQFDVAPDGTLSPKTPPTAAAGNDPDGITIAPDGRSVYVANFGTATISQYDVAPGGQLTLKTPPTVNTQSGVVGLTISPDGRNLYVPEFSGTTLSQYDVGAGGVLSTKVPASVSGFQNPGVATVSPDSLSVYVANYATSGFVSQLDIGAGGLLSPKSPGTAAAGTKPYQGIAISPDQGPVARFSAAPGRPGAATRFDGSGSSDSDGRVARYDWDFGDGTSAPNGGPNPTHVYARAGTYTVTLTVTDEIGCSTAMVFTGNTASCSGTPAARTSQPVATKDTTRPRLSRFTLGPSAFAAAASGPSASKVKVGTTVRYRSSEAAVTTFTVQRPARGVKRGKRCVKPGKGKRGGKRCTRYVRLRGSFTHKDAAGANHLKFRGRLRRHKLSPGRYRLVATPRDAAGNVGRPARHSFRILRRH
jgi:DNA-binding beta-propeller fold protein YncE